MESQLTLKECYIQYNATQGLCAMGNTVMSMEYCDCSHNTSGSNTNSNNNSTSNSSTASSTRLIVRDNEDKIGVMDLGCTSTSTNNSNNTNNRSEAH